MQNGSIDTIYGVKSVSADPFTQCFRLYPDPESGAPSLSVPSPAKHKSSIQEQNIHPQSIMSFSQLDLDAVGAENRGTSPVLAGIECSVGSLASVVILHSNQQRLDLGCALTEGQGELQA